jgi:hypothetical protein
VGDAIGVRGMALLSPWRQVGPEAKAQLTGKKKPTPWWAFSSVMLFQNSFCWLVSFG